MAANELDYPDTYYSRTLADHRLRASLVGDCRADAAIVGGGLAGLTAALQLARGGVRVAVLESRRLGFGASGRNGGFVTAGYSIANDQIAAMIGEDRARELHRLSVEGVDFVRQAIVDLEIGDACVRKGSLRVLRYDDGERLKRQLERSASSFGYELDYVETDEVRTVLKSQRYFQGIRDRQAFHIHPLNYLRALAAEIERLGGTIYEATEVTSAGLDGAEKSLSTQHGRVLARDVIFATGGYTTSLVRQLHRAYLPIATYVMISEAAPELISQAVSTHEAIGDNRRAGDYYRLVDDGRRLLWGGRITTQPASAAGLARELRRELVGTYPQLAPLRTDLAWSGLMSYSRSQMPQIGMLKPGVWYCTAFGGHGLNTTAIGGAVIAEAILGQSDRYRMFAPFGLDWTGGAIGLAAAQITYWKLQAQDWWRERWADAIQRTAS